VSDISNDKQVVNEGRSSPLTGVDAPLRDRIVAKLYKKLEELNVAQKVDTLWRRGNSNRSAWLQRRQEYLASWDEHLIADTEGPFDGSSQLHIPMPLIIVKTLHARFLQAIWQDPPFHTKARNEASIERVPMVQDTMRYYLMDGANHNKGVEEVVDKWVWDWVSDGSGVTKWRWDVEYTRFIDVEMQMMAGAPIVQVVDGVEQIVAGPPAPKEVEVSRMKKCFEGPSLELVDLEDLLIVGGGGDPDAADAVLHRQYLTASELWTLADRKVFNKKAVEAIISAGASSRDSGEGSGIKTQRAQNAGQSELDTESDLDRYEIIEAYLKMDVDGSGINSEIVAWVHARTGSLCRATYLHRISRTGERPFNKADFQIRKHQEYGTGMVEMLYPLSKEMDAIHNMRIDFGLISVMPFGFYRASSGLDPEEIRFEPGMLIPVDNPQTDVFFPNLGNRTVFGFQEEQALDNLIQRLSGVNEMSMGMMTSQGATRTATGARALVGEASANLDVFVRRLNRGWKKSLRYLLHMLQQRIPAGMSFRLTGDAGADYWRTIRDKSEIEGDFDIEVSPNSASSNMGVQQEIAGQIMASVADPLAIQLGIVTPAQYYEAKKNQLQSLGVKDFGKYLQKPQGYQRTFTPEEEANRVLRGMEVSVGPDSDHEGFLAFYEHFVDTDELIGQFSEEQTLALAAHAKRHEQMAQALKQMQAQAANSAQMQRNSAQSQQQSAPGLAPQATPGGAAAGPMSA
jgi:hypothetical protein